MPQSTRHIFPSGKIRMQATYRLLKFSRGGKDEALRKEDISRCNAWGFDHSPGRFDPRPQGPTVVNARSSAWPSVALRGVGCGTPPIGAPVAQVPCARSVDVVAPSA